MSGKPGCILTEYAFEMIIETFGEYFKRAFALIAIKLT